MRDLRQMAADLVDRPLAVPSSMDALHARAVDYRRRRQLRSTSLAIVALVLVSAVGLQAGWADERAPGQRVHIADSPGTVDTTITLPSPVGELLPPPLGGTTTTTTAPPSTTTSTTRPSTPPTTQPPAGGQECPANAGATDAGVTGTTVDIVARQRLGTSWAGLRSVIDQANRDGGVCGRVIRLTQVTTGNALPPSSSYFALVPDSHDPAIDPAGVPVVGSDGLAAAEYRSDWVWPVGTAATSQAHIAVRHAYDAGARTFGIVYDKRAFGTEADTAFANAVTRLTGADPKASVGVDAGKPSYASEFQTFAGGCGSGGCDLMLLALDANTALAFLSEGTQRGKVETAALSPVISLAFAQSCKSACDKLVLWAPYQLPYDQSDPDVAQYVTDMRAMSPSTDVYDVNNLRGYVAGKALVAALRQVGPNLTRARLQQVLDATRYSSGLVPLVNWTDNALGNLAAKGVQIQAGGGFGGFREVSGWITDPWAGQDRP